ncbi:hypothetical protein BKA80DRAFT_262430 [Phyllosticta citrichinensis]
MHPPQTTGLLHLLLLFALAAPIVARRQSCAPSRQGQESARGWNVPLVRPNCTFVSSPRLVHCRWRVEATRPSTHPALYRDDNFDNFTSCRAVPRPPPTRALRLIRLGCEHFAAAAAAASLASRARCSHTRLSRFNPPSCGLSDMVRHVWHPAKRRRFPCHIPYSTSIHPSTHPEQDGPEFPVIVRFCPGPPAPSGSTRCKPGQLPTIRPNRVCSSIKFGLLLPLP